MPSDGFWYTIEYRDATAGGSWMPTTLLTQPGKGMPAVFTLSDATLNTTGAFTAGHTYETRVWRLSTNDVTAHLVVSNTSSAVASTYTNTVSLLGTPITFDNGNNNGVAGTTTRTQTKVRIAFTSANWQYVTVEYTSSGVKKYGVIKTNSDTLPSGFTADATIIEKIDNKNVDIHLSSSLQLDIVICPNGGSNISITLVAIV